MEPSEFYEYEDRAYIQPTLSSGEQQAFIDNLRNIQAQNNAQIAEQTYNLGTQVPSNLGGLGGGEAYFNARYQTPQVGEMVATLKSAAQAQELSDILNNYQSQLKQKYSSAQRSYNKRQRARQRAYMNSLLGGGNTGGTGGVATGKVNVNSLGGNASVLGEGNGIAASNSDVPAGEVYSTLFTGAVDANGNPITGHGVTTFDKSGKPVYTTDPAYTLGSGSFDLLSTLFSPTTTVNTLRF